ncbi:MAG: asparagine synthetase B [Acidobacteria bacterium]|nr:asparagine synthetase B [Acidobacteriota bacterium]
MSGIGAVISLDGSSPDPALIARLCESLSRLGPDGINAWQGVSSALIHAHFHTAPEALQQRQPFQDPEGRCVITLDGRIDNREELIRDLRVSNQEVSDPELVLFSYKKQGVDCVRSLLGDFAWAIWDGEKQELFCARDVLGVRPLYYCRSGKSLLVASDLNSLILATGVSPSVNWQLISEMVAGEFHHWQLETGYAGFFRFPQAHYLVSGFSEHESWHRYWTIGEQGEEHYKRDSDYIDRFKELLEQSVASCLKSSHPVALLVSGGVDSSSIASVANALMKAGRTRSKLYLCSALFQNTPGADERRYVDAIRENCAGLMPLAICGDEYWSLKEWNARKGEYCEPEVSADGSLVVGLLRKAKEQGCRVVVSGHWGDQVLCGDAYLHGRTLHDVPFDRLFSELPFFLDRSRWWEILLSYAFFALPPPVGNRLRSFWKAHRRQDRFISVRVRREPPRLHPSPTFKAQSARLTYGHLMSGWDAARRSTMEYWAAATGIEWRFPFQDRRLVDFLLNIPPRLRFQRGQKKYILREAMQGVLGDTVRMRDNAAYFDSLLERGVRSREKEQLTRLLCESRLAKAGIVEQSALLEYWHRSLEDTRVSVRPMLWSILAEKWLQKFERFSCLT